MNREEIAAKSSPTQHFEMLAIVDVCNRMSGIKASFQNGMSVGAELVI